MKLARTYNEKDNIAVLKNDGTIEIVVFEDGYWNYKFIIDENGKVDLENEYWKPDAEIKKRFGKVLYDALNLLDT